MFSRGVRNLYIGSIPQTNVTNLLSSFHNDVLPRTCKKWKKYNNISYIAHGQNFNIFPIIPKERIIYDTCVIVKRIWYAQCGHDESNNSVEDKDGTFTVWQRMVYKSQMFKNWIWKMRFQTLKKWKSL